MQRTTTSLTILGLLVCAAAARTQTPAESVSVGAWNIEWLGDPGRRSKPAKGIAQDPNHIADYLHASGADIVGLEEIGIDAPGVRKSAELEAAFAILEKQHGRRWDYTLFAKADPNDTHQHTGLAWDRARAKLVGEPWRIPVESSREDGIWSRHPWAVQLSFGAGKTDAVFIVVHQKSNYGGVAPARAKREEEARRLAAQLGAVRKKLGDQDVVVLGDFNWLEADEPAAQLLGAAGLRDLNAADETTRWKGESPLDRILVPAGQAEFAGAERQDVFDQEFLQPRSLGAEAFKRLYSDHYMVLTTIQVMPDDDP